MDSPLAAPISRVARRLFGLALAVTTALWAGAAAALDEPPEPTTPGGVVALLKWCWTHKDAQRYHDLFTADYQFIPEAPDLPWTRDDELGAAARLFGAGNGTQPGANTITLDWLGSNPPTPGTAYLPGEPYPAYQQFLGIASIAVTRTDNSIVSGQGPTMFHLIRGDLASIPQELRDRGVGPDPNRWYIQKWEDMPAPEIRIDHAPLLTAPDSVSIKALKTMHFRVSAGDPDAEIEPPLIITSSDLPEGATFTVRDPEISHCYCGNFDWTPTAAQQGTYTVTFTMTNGLTVTKTVNLEVRPPNVLPVAHLTVTPTSGIEPLTVHLSAAGSHDDDGQIVYYAFEFGDGWSALRTTPDFDHTYAAGHWQPTVRVFDDTEDIAVATADVQVGSSANLARNPSFETDLRYWNSYAGSVLERVEGVGRDGNFGLQITGPPVINGSFGVNDSPDNIRWTVAAGTHYRYTAWVRSPSSHGQAKLRVTEYLIAGGVKLGQATSDPVTLSPDWQQLTVDYTTTAANATLDFQVRDWPIVPSEVFITDDIAIRNVTAVGAGTGMAAWYDGEHDPVPMEARLAPSPMRGSGTLRFMTSHRGPLRVDLIDLAGRRVRSLMNEGDAPAGLYELSVTRLGDDGRRLGPGVYFWRVAGGEGTKTGRFVMLQ